MSGSIHGHRGISLRALRRRSRVLTWCVWILIVVLPIQGVAVVASSAWRPAHYHRHLAVSTHPTSPLAVPAREDVVLERLDDTANADVDGRPDFGAAFADARPGHGAAIGYHRHALDDPDVVYLDDPGQSPGDIAKHAPDLPMLAQAGWPPLPWSPSVAAVWPDPAPAAANRGTPPPERPPRA